MPTERKIQQVAELKDQIGRAEIAIATTITHQNTERFITGPSDMKGTTSNSLLPSFHVSIVTTAAIAAGAGVAWVKVTVGGMKSKTTDLLRSSIWLPARPAPRVRCPRPTVWRRGCGGSPLRNRSRCLSKPDDPWCSKPHPTEQARPTHR